MNDAAYLENSNECIFGSPLHIANFVSANGKPGWKLLDMKSMEAVDALVMAGDYDILALLFTSRIDAKLPLADSEKTYGWKVVRSAAFHRCLRLVEQTLAATGQANEREKMEDAIKSLRAIGSDARVGAAINDFAKRQADSIELRMETPAKRRWLNGTGHCQAFCGTFIRAYDARNKLQRQPPTSLPARAKAFPW